ncbi:hypothetical protein NESM_000527400 [Novymonas esmeraldas]|uniref:Uncharacterized protein n=1 Tax=Novymonas esmeraldas TaxID=1808958 RepID=A0AAW0EP13_9TRYP
MMRRRCVAGGGLGDAVTVACTAAAALPTWTSRRRQSSTGGGGGGGSGGARGVHTFIRDNAAPSSTFHSSPSGASHGGGASPRVAPASSAAPAAESPPLSDWAVRLQRELMSPVDPLGGLAHKDYYRDPATGYAPQYAPRDFVSGGAIAYPHAHGSGSAHDSYAAAAARRDWLEHDVATMSATAQDARATARRLGNAAERDTFMQRQTPSHRHGTAVPMNASLTVADQLRATGPLSEAKVHQQTTLDRYRAQAASPSAAVSYTTATGLSGGDLAETVAEDYAGAADDSVDEQLRIAHGLRARERFNFNVLQRTARVPFEGYDMDRFAAQRAGGPHGAQQLPPVVPASSLEEAVKHLRGGSAGLPPTEAEARRTYALNTVSDDPKLGEALTGDVVSGLHARRQRAKEAKQQERKQRFGLGRQGALVQDGGPDRRVLRRHTNDERLLDAVRFASNAYRHTATDEHVDPYVRRSTESGVGHLLTNRFDMARREDRVAHGLQDITERNTVHYGVPIQQSVDEFVFSHRNARGDRPLDYFKPFPNFRAQRLHRMYRDVEGFSLIKQRPEVFEWELFTRYRAHHQQRRELALLHGLEPVANETVAERAARRLALDVLCEATPFDTTKLHRNDDEMRIDAGTLRSWFGAYVLPSPTIVESVLRVEGGALGLHLHNAEDELHTDDTREHILSSRYVNRLLLFEGFHHRWGRGFTKEVSGRAPEPVVKHAQPPHVLKYFDAEERAMYQQYVQRETGAQLEDWERRTRGRRYVVERQQYGEVVAQGYAVAVVDVQHQETGAVVSVSAEQWKGCVAAMGSGAAAGPTAAPTTSSSSTIPSASQAPQQQQQQQQQQRLQSATARMDGEVYSALPGSERTVVPLSVRLESGESMDTTDDIFSAYPLEVPASATHNHALNYGIGAYHYNRGNYVETQDVIWESDTAAQEEGWSPATHADGLRPGLPVRARRRLGPVSTAAEGHATDSGGGAAITGDYQRARIVEYHRQPFFNPDPRLVTVAFAADDVVQEVPLADILIWQRRYHGPERTTGDESRRYNPGGLHRFIDVADPHGERGAAASRTSSGTTTAAAAAAAGGDHFLDKYERRLQHDQTSAKYRTSKQITELDQWTRFDTTRADNYRPLSISHRRDYVRQGYLPRYTPWEWIVTQEADQPIILDTVRSDDVGASHVFSFNRAWRYKARPHGYLRNYDKEVRDLVQFVDGVTPWAQAQKIRTYWEVRQHHPMPQFNRPEVAMHRNSAGLLPSHMWETDKKSGKVRAVKDSVRDYQTKTPLPKWVQL